MSYSHVVRITLPYADCSGIIRQWSDRCVRSIVFEHEADEEISKTHVHLILDCCETKSEALKRMWKDAPGKGNEFWSWKDWDGNMKFVSYMTKGVLREKYNKNFSPEEVETSRQSWVEPVKADKPGDSSEYIVVKILKHFDGNDFKTHYGVRDMEDDNIGIGTILERVRKHAFNVLWGEHRRVPHASHYKIIAGTAFLRLCERLDRFDEGADALRNLWY